jgi:hypothetical protein
MLRRPAWRPEPAHDFVPVPCTTCHKPQVAWLRRDPHSGSARPFLDGSAAQLAIAQRYGLSPEEMVKGNQICMSCHGTVTANPNARVRNGVDCQQCHGPGKDYRDSHQEEDYSRSLTRGMVDLKTPATRARACSSCHYITDERLLSAGHTSGADFKLDERVTRIKHWGGDFKGDAEDVAPASLRSAYAAVLADRGPVPQVTVAAGGSAAPAPGPAPAVASGPPPSPSSGGVAPPPATSGAGTTTTTASSSNPASAGSSGAVQGGVTPPGTRAAEASAPDTPTASGEATTAPAVSSTPVTSVDEVLLFLKQRLEQLYARLRGGGER